MGGKPRTAQVAEKVQIPPEVSELFTPAILSKLEAVVRPAVSKADHAAEPMRQRHLLFSGAALSSNALTARRAAWWAYLAHASKVGLLAVKDIRRRLTDVCDDNFRGALAECSVSWFFTEQLQSPLARNEAATGKAVDFHDSLGVGIEVKAPYVPLLHQVFSGDDSRTIRECVQKAGRQCKKGGPNLVVLVPLLRTPVWMDREQFVKSIIGEWAYSYSIALNDGDEVDEPRSVFLQKGKLAKLHKKGSDGVTTDLTRISAVATIEEETMWTDSGVELRHYVHVVHNPFAECRFPSDTFSEFPQLLAQEDGNLAWFLKGQRLESAE